MITPLPGITTCKPGSATRTFPGIKAEIKTDKGDSIDVGGGLLALTRPWPSMLRGIYGDPDRYVTQVPGAAGRPTSTSPATAPSAIRTASSGCSAAWTTCSNVAGHRIGTMEVESALVDHPRVAEAAVVGRPHEIKGQAVAAFVTLEGRRRRRAKR